RQPAGGNPWRPRRPCARSSYAGRTPLRPGTTTRTVVLARASRDARTTSPMPRPNIPARGAHGPLVVGIGRGPGVPRAGGYDDRGREVGKLQHKEIHAFTVDDDGTSTIDADQIVAEIRTALSAVLGHGELPGDVRAIGFDTFASSLIAVDTAGNALTPCITYADTRCHAQVGELASRVDVDALHERTGARLHSSYTAPRLLWLRKEHPEVFARTERFMALGEYVAFKLLG